MSSLALRQYNPSEVRRHTLDYQSLLTHLQASSHSGKFVG